MGKKKKSKVVLEGPAAEAVERLARSGRMSVADLIASALRREAKAQQKKKDSGV